MSRVQRFDFRRIGPQKIVERLSWVAEQEGINVEADALQLIARVADGGMRDGLSLLDQALAFGEGQITASRVRDTLGLIDHELYADLLAIIAEHRSADVFPFVSRLIEAGADLTELIHGIGEVLRALLLQILGGRPDGLTESLRAAIELHARWYGAGDILRMLKLLAATENAVRVSPNVRIHVETLLLQWSLLDRTVDLTEVLAALGDSQPPVRPPAHEPSPRISEEHRAKNVQVDNEPPTDPGHGPQVLTLETLRARWPEVVLAVGHKRPMVRELLGHASPVAVHDDVVELEVSDSEVHLEGLERNRANIANGIRDVMGSDVARLVYKPGISDSAAKSATPLTRLSRDDDQAERLKFHRKAAPGLDAIVDALDLEVTE